MIYLYTSTNPHCSLNLVEQFCPKIKKGDKNRRTVEDYLKTLLDKLNLYKEGEDLTGLLPCNLAT